MADRLIVLDYLDSDVLAEARKQELNISHEFAYIVLDLSKLQSNLASIRMILATMLSGMMKSSLLA